MSALSASVIVSCEHAGNDIPAAYRPLFDSTAAREALDGHRGWDPGSAELGEAFAAELGAPIVVQRVSRLLVECNRSLDHPRLFSEFARGAPSSERQQLIDRYWAPHREAVRSLVREVTEKGAVAVHVSVHTFTPVWNGRRRATDIGLLYDPRREPERSVSHRWRDAVRTAELAEAGSAPAPRVHLNRPYRGWSDGLTTTLRGEFPETRYVGIEIEVSQAMVNDRRFAAELGRRMARALRDALERTY